LGQAVDEKPLQEVEGRGPAGWGNKAEGNKTGLKEKQKAGQQNWEKEGRDGKGSRLGSGLLETTKGAARVFQFPVMVGRLHGEDGEIRQRREKGK